MAEKAVVVQTQSALASATLWINLLTIVVAIGGHATEILPDEYQPYIAAGLAVANALLRVLKTNAPIDRVV